MYALCLHLYIQGQCWKSAHLRNLNKSNTLNETHGSVVIGVRSVTQSLLVQTPQWSLGQVGVVCFVLGQGSLLTFSQSNQLEWLLPYARVNL